MAPLGRSCLLLVLSLATFFFNPSFAKLRPNVTNDQIASICARSQAPSFCFRVLTNETLHANQTNLHGLAKISIGIALAGAYETQAAITPLIKQAKNFTEREGYTLCAENYEEAVGSLKAAKHKLSKHDYRGVRVEARAALEEANACQHDVKIPEYNPSPFQEKNRDFKRYCTIIWAISNRLV